MNDFPKISEAEREVMRVIWAEAPCTASDIIDKLEGPTTWSPKTVRSLLNRLVQKKAIAYNQVNRIYEYYPLVSQEACNKQETQIFLKRIGGTGLKPWFMHFLKDEKLSREDIEDLKKILEAKEPNQNV